jgi:type IV secretory pathway VirD2 relaxase
MYSRNGVRGQWGAHGRYVARESATHAADSRAIGFDHQQESIDLAAKLNGWQKAGDDRMWKFIISPEFGDRVDLQRLTRDLMKRIQSHLGESQIEWIAVAHYNTEHPHVHMALRGVDGQRRPIQFDREYVKTGIRSVAEELCTQQLGYRTELDAAIAARSEVTQHRYTSLDRMIARAAATNTQTSDLGFSVYLQQPTKPGTREGAALRQQHTAERLWVLQKMGLAQPTGPNAWLVRRDFENVLRAMQRMTDRQKILVRHGVPMSDDRLLVTVLDYRNLKSIEGRVLVHGEEETGREAGRSYLMLEGTDARVHYIYYTPEIDEARSRGDLRTNSFVRLRKTFVDGEPVLEIKDLGDSEALLRNGAHLKQTARTLIKRGIVPDEDGWGGWLGRYQAALRRTALDELEVVQRTQKMGAARRKSKSHER